MMFDGLTYQIGEIPENPQILQIDGSGRARYESHTNEHSPDPPEIGIYEANLNAVEVSALLTLLESPPLSAVPDHWGQVRSGELYRRIKMTQGANTTEKLVGTRLAVAPEMRRVIDALDRIVARTKTNPVQTLHLDWSDPAVDAQHRFTATVSLTNRGVQDATCSSPGQGAPADGVLSIEAWPDVPQPDPNDLVTTGVDSVQTAAAGGTLPAMLTIPPKGSSSFRIGATLQVKRQGPHLVRLVYRSLASPPGSGRMLTGMIVSKTARINAR